MSQRGDELALRLRDPLDTVNLYSPRIAEEYMKTLKKGRHGSRPRLQSGRMVKSTSLQKKIKRTSGLPKIHENNGRPYDGRHGTELNAPSEASLPLAEPEQSSPGPQRTLVPFDSNPEIAQWESPDDRLPLIETADSKDKSRNDEQVINSPKSLVALGAKKSRMSPSPSVSHHGVSNPQRYMSLDVRQMNELSSINPKDSNLNVSDPMDPILQRLDRPSQTTISKINSRKKMSKLAYVDLMSRRDLYLHKKLKDQ